jgi:hypothetical protein
MTYERNDVDGALADKLAEAVEHNRQAIAVMEASKLQAVLHLTLSTAALQEVEKALRTGEQPAEKPAAKVVPMRKLAVVRYARAEGEPLPDWMLRKDGGPDDVG